MARRLNQNLNSAYFEVANHLRPSRARSRIVAYVESFDDIAFWRSILDDYETTGCLDRSLFARYQTHHHIFVASARTVIEEHKINPDFKIGMMTIGHPVYANTCNPDDVKAMNDELILESTRLKSS